MFSRSKEINHWAESDYLKSFYMFATSGSYFVKNGAYLVDFASF